MYLYSKFPVIELLGQEKCAFNFGRYCEVILQKVDVTTSSSRVGEWHIAHMWPILDIDDQLFNFHFFAH